MQTQIECGYCQCGCGARTRIAERTSGRKGTTKGEPYRYVKNHHFTGKHHTVETKAKMSQSMAGQNSKPAKDCVSTQHGYVWVRMPDHPRANADGYLPRYIKVLEDNTGMRVPRTLCVHHINRNRSDDRIENLMVITRTDHTRLHRALA